MVNEALIPVESFLKRFPNVIGLIKWIGVPTIILGVLLYWLAGVAYPDFMQAKRDETTNLLQAKKDETATIIALVERMEARHQAERASMYTAIRTALENGLRDQGAALRELTKELQDQRRFASYLNEPVPRGNMP